LYNFAARPFNWRYTRTDLEADSAAQFVTRRRDSSVWPIVG
jgi:hypothetical protein